MGRSNIIDFIQDIFESMGSLAGVPLERVIKIGEAFPMVPLAAPREFFSFYGDKFDNFKVVVATDRGVYDNRPSEAQLRLREVFRVWGVDRDEKKAAEGKIRWSSLGAGQFGDEGLVGSPRKFRMNLLGSGARLLMLSPA